MERSDRRVGCPELRPSKLSVVTHMADEVFDTNAVVKWMISGLSIPPERPYAFLLATEICQDSGDPRGAWCLLDLSRITCRTSHSASTLLRMGR